MQKLSSSNPGFSTKLACDLLSITDSRNIPSKAKALIQSYLVTTVKNIKPGSEDALALLRVAHHNKAFFGSHKSELHQEKINKLREMARFSMSKGDLQFVLELTNLLSLETLIQDGMLDFLKDEKHKFSFQDFHFGILFSSREFRKNKDVASAMDEAVTRMIQDAELRGDVYFLSRFAIETKSRLYFKRLKNSPM